MKILLALIVFNMFLFKGRLVLGIVQQLPGRERVESSVKNQKNVTVLLHLIEK